MHFELLGPLTQIETFAVGSQIREIARLRKLYGHGRWRKRKGIAVFGSRMAPLMSLRFTGMRRRE